ncbi:MAG: poly(A) polymerase [Flavobacteriaceae bacterium]|nr:poly(A) polymerase [Flavobacteriaceae bacterium]
MSSKDWNKRISPFAVDIIKKLQDHNYEAYLVGGCVRDLLANIEPKDFDIATNAEPKEIRKIFKASRIIGKRFQLVHVYKGRQIIEVATFRAGLNKNNTNIENDLIKDDAGKIIRDNIWGSIEDDCNRRDFTINAIYFCPINKTFKDFHDGIQHVKEKKVISIGDPLYRFEEDPVRSLRAMRFATKLNFKIDSKVKKAIYKKGDLLDGISNARLFDEFCKIFLNGYGYENFKKLESYGVAKYLLNLEKKYSENKVYTESFKNTDKRYKDGKSITPGFLLAAILWPKLIERCSFDKGINVRKFFRSMDSIIAEQQRITAIPRKFTSYIKDIWYLQLKLNDRLKNNPNKIIKHPRFRAGYDFLLIRENASKDKSDLGKWWTSFQHADTKSKQKMIEKVRKTIEIDGNFNPRKGEGKEFGFSDELR